MSKLVDVPVKAPDDNLDGVVAIGADGSLGKYPLPLLTDYIRSKLVVVSDTPPSSPQIGDIWVDTSI